MKDYSKIEVYSNVKEVGFLPKKEKYTKRDVDRLLVESLFVDTEKTLEVSQAVFVVKCSAIHHGTNYSKIIDKMTLNYEID